MMINFKSDSDNLISIHTSVTPEGLPFKAQSFTIQFNQQAHSFLRPHNPNDVLDSLPEECYTKDRFLPYWAEQWPSSEVMLSFIGTQKLPGNIKIIELGCGLGIISTLTGLAASPVVATDISFDALLFTKINIELNSGRPLPCCFDWRSPPFKSKFDLLIACDVLYESRWIDPVLTCCTQLLSPGGKAWIADPCRSFWELFKTRARASGFVCNVVQSAKACEGKHTIEIVELRKLVS